ncbi:HNH/endonuclease VII fold putative polymorphic toxin [Pseudomonas fluorescens]|uniref:HNH/endonuclease VII fold putative polymorphic toxin n=1 Tax=Pseudomonas sp. FP597 TaxID=2954096 RepID=UPI0012F4DFEB
MGRVYVFSLKKPHITRIHEHSLGHTEGNHGPHFNTKNTAYEIKTPLKMGHDSHTYFKR